MSVTIRRCSYRVSAIQAARAAASLKRDRNVDENIVDGHYCELSVLVDGEQVLTAGALGSSASTDAPQDS